MSQVKANHCIFCGGANIQSITKEYLDETQIWIQVTVYDCPDCENVFGIVSDRGIKLDQLGDYYKGEPKND